MGFYKDLALPLAARGIPTVPLRPRTKIAFISEWETLATTNPAQIELWDKQYPNANCASVAQDRLDGFWFLEGDRPEFFERLKKETGQGIPLTFIVRSRPGRGHIYFKQSAASITMGNIAQGFVKDGDWSARVSNAYVVSPGSLHPITGTPYEVLSSAQIIEAPQWLIDWCISQRIEKKLSISPDSEKIPYGSHDVTLTSIAGKLRHNGMEEETLISALIEICEKRCVNYGADYKEMCAKIGHSICQHPIGKDDIVLVGGKVAGTTVSATPDLSPLPIIEVEEATEIKVVPYPVFPEWIMHGTSIYGGLVKPVCDANSRIKEFLWLPAMALLLNYVGTRVRIDQNPNMPLSIFLAIIGRRGETHKSSSVSDAINYFEYAGMVGHGDASIRNADSRALVFTPASPEGLGKEMARLGCKNGILFYDELRALTNKAGIDGSTLTSSLLTLYESGKFQNIVKSQKDSFSLLPNTYCASLIACSTDKNFLGDWSRLAGKSTGLDDRFFFLYQPKILPEAKVYQHVPTQEAAIKTRQLVDLAVAKGSYSISDPHYLDDFVKRNENSGREEIRIEKFALGFAIDLGLDEIDSECLERAVRLIGYEKAAKKYLQMFEASTREGSIQLEILHHLQRAGGNLSLREIYRLLHPERLGTTLWSSAYFGLMKGGWCREEGKGSKGDPKKLVLLRMPEEDD